MGYWGSEVQILSSRPFILLLVFVLISMHPYIKFGTDGWRAIIADKFTFNNLKIVVAAIAIVVDVTVVSVVTCRVRNVVVVVVDG